MKPRAELLAMAERLSDAAERKLAIEGLCETAAESGSFQVAFPRTDYLLSDFHHLSKLFRVEVSPSYVHVSFEEPIAS